MDALAALFEALMFFLGIYQEHKATLDQCEQMWAQGYVVYPLSEQEQERAKRCAELMRGE